MNTHIRNFPASDLNLVSFIVVDYNAWIMSDWRYDAKHDVLDQDAWTRYENSKRDFGFKCDCCGHTLIYACVVEHVPTGHFYHVGRDCFANVECLQHHRNWVSLTGDRLAARVAAGKKAAKERKAGDVREATFFEQNPDMVAVFNFADQPPVAADHPSYQKICYAVATIGSMRSTIRRYGNLSDGQSAFACKLYSESLAKLDQDRERAQQVAAAVANGLRAPEGRVAVEGTVVSAKWVESDFGGAYKCLVDLGNGTRVYGTLPASADNAERGSKVSFTATFEVSAKDPLFAFYKRPTKWVAAPVGAGESASHHPQKIAA
jgi:hypothetical protein